MEHKHLRKEPYQNVCICGAEICSAMSPDNAMVCVLIKGHSGKHFDPWYPEYSAWGEEGEQNNKQIQNNHEAAGL